jgi:hypothetical protein
LKPHLPCYRCISKNFKQIKYHRKHIHIIPHGPSVWEHAQDAKWIDVVEVLWAKPRSLRGRQRHLCFAQTAGLGRNQQAAREQSIAYAPTATPSQAAAALRWRWLP